MSSLPVPLKQDLPKEIWKVATTLSEDAQNAAMQKARELGFDLNKGRISLEETLLNLSHNRDILLDAVEKNKLIQLPLKLQYNLLGQIQKISESLTALANGTDALLALEDSVDDLMSLVWQYNLHNLSKEVLGFETKMNQLKAQEAMIRKVHRDAQDFEKSNARALELLGGIEGVSKKASELASFAQSSVDQVAVSLKSVQEQEQKVAALSVQSQQYDSATAQYSATAKTASADVSAIATKVQGLAPEIENAKVQLEDLTAKTRQLISSTEQTVTQNLDDLKNKFEQFRADQEAQSTAIRDRLNNSVQESVANGQNKIEALTSDAQTRSVELDAGLKKNAADIEDLLAKEQSAHQARLTLPAQTVDATLA